MKLLTIATLGEKHHGNNSSNGARTNSPKIRTYPNMRPSKRTMPPRPLKSCSLKPERRPRLLRLHSKTMQRRWLHRTKRTMSKSFRSSSDKRKGIFRSLYAKLPQMRRIENTIPKTRINPGKNHLRSLTSRKNIKAKYSCIRDKTRGGSSCS
jgi:hypothetical protein